MTDRLTALNRSLAVYTRDPLAPERSFDAFKYLNDLLSIRSSRGLALFLAEYPAGLVPLRPAHELKREQKAVPLPSGPLSFGEPSMMKAASDAGVDWLDALTDLDGARTLDDELRRWRDELGRVGLSDGLTAERAESFRAWLSSMPAPDLYCLSLAELEDVIARVGLLLHLAGVSYGMFDGADAASFPQETLLDGLLAPQQPTAAGVLVVVDEDKLAQLLPDPAITSRVPASANVTAMGVRLERLDNGQIVALAHRASAEEAAWDAAGAVVAFVLSELARYHVRTDPVTFDADRGYQIGTSEANPAIAELARIIAGRRFGFCPVCGRPFVVKRRPVGGAINKTFCTNSCKVKGSRGKEARKPKGARP